MHSYRERMRDELLFAATAHRVDGGPDECRECRKTGELCAEGYLASRIAGALSRRLIKLRAL